MQSSVTFPGEIPVVCVTEGLGLHLTEDKPLDEISIFCLLRCWTSGLRNAFANVIAAPAITSERDGFFSHFGVIPVIAGMSGGLSVLSWFPASIIRAHKRS